MLDVVLTLGLLGLSACAAGAVNAVAGGGSLISFPAALAAGLSPVTASATNTVALTPAVIGSAWAYRRELRGKLGLISVLGAPAAAGGVAGALLLLQVPERVFELVVPALVLGATLLVLLRQSVARFALAPERASGPRRGLAGAGVLVVAVYGGYFGAGIGIILLGILAMVQRMSLNEMNAVKCVVAAIINGVAAAYFLWRGAAALAEAGVMALGSSLGGYGGAWLARRVPPRVLQGVVVCVGLAVGFVLVARQWWGK